MLFLMLGLPVLLVGAVLLAKAAARGRPPGRRTAPFFLTLAALIAALRVGCLWYVLRHAWGGTMSLDVAVLEVLLLPEGWLAAGRDEMTAPAALLLSAALCAGSLVWAALLTLAARAVGDIR